MFSPNTFIGALALTALLTGAGLARAADTPIASAGGAAPGVTSGGGDVANQIDRYLRTSPAVALPGDDAMGVTSSTEPRKVHGEVSVAVGSGGYRSVYARSDLPVGKTGTVSIAVADSHYNGRYGGRYGAQGGQSLGLGFNFSDAAADSSGGRCPGSRGDYRGRRIDPAFLDDDGEPHCARLVPSPY